MSSRSAWPRSTALAEHLTAAAQGRIGATELNDIVARAEGNAYYAEELLAASVSGDRPEHSLPAGLAALLLSRVEQCCPTPPRNTPRGGGGLRQGRRRAGAGRLGLQAAEYENAVREAVTHQLLVPDGSEGYVFRHALLREAVYGDLLPGERTRLHGTMSALLAEESGWPCPEPRPNWPSTAWPATTSPVRSPRRSGPAKAAERLGAPAEAHRHYDQALALWERVADPEQTAGMHRGKLGLLSATNAADSGDVDRAVHLLRRLRHVLATLADQGEAAAPVNLASRIGERLAFYLWTINDVKTMAEAVISPGHRRTDAAQPPTWRYARRWRPTPTPCRSTTTSTWPAAGRAPLAAAPPPGPLVQADALVALDLSAEKAATTRPSSC